MSRKRIKVAISICGVSLSRPSRREGINAWINGYDIVYILDTSGPGVDAQRPPATVGDDKCRAPKNITIVEHNECDSTKDVCMQLT